MAIAKQYTALSLGLSFASYGFVEADAYFIRRIEEKTCRPYGSMIVRVMVEPSSKMLRAHHFSLPPRW